MLLCPAFGASVLRFDRIRTQFNAIDQRMCSMSVFLPKYLSLFATCFRMLSLCLRAICCRAWPSSSNTICNVKFPIYSGIYCVWVSFSHESTIPSPTLVYSPQLGTNTTTSARTRRERPQSLNAPYQMGRRDKALKPARTLSPLRAYVHLNNEPGGSKVLSCVMLL